MYKKIIICFTAVTLLSIGCTSSETIIEDNCSANSYKCEDDAFMQCLSGTTQKNETVSYWVKLGYCVNGCNPEETKCACIAGVCDDFGKRIDCKFGNNDDGSCKCSPECANGCDETGACLCSIQCDNGCDITGKTCCETKCQNSCDTTGKCLCPITDGKPCANGCDSSGKACCDEKCVNGCDFEGKCTCLDSCKNGCDETGTCKCPDGCTHCADDGSCKCQESCHNGCDATGVTCCDENCQNGCDTTGKCLCPVIDGKTCPNRCDDSGLICCKDECKNGCYTDGSCKGAKTCDNGCATNEYCKESENLCYLIDANWNHMDDRSETAPTQGKDCRVDKDCNSGSYYKGFCDSFLGYKCSTKCTKNEQCVDNELDDFHYICRKDGRCAPDEFVTVWDIDINQLHNHPHNDIDQLLMFYETDDSSCNIAIDWGDNTKCGHWDDDTTETKSCCIGTEIYHRYEKSGEYTIRIKGKYVFANPDENDRMFSAKTMLREVKAFGQVGLGLYSFNNASHLVRLSDVDIPDSSQLKSMERFFQEATSLSKNDNAWSIPIENWDVSNVKSMNGTFASASFNQPLAKWNVASVTTMEKMFNNNTIFNQPLEEWDVSNVTNMTSMFYNASAFNQPIEKWDVSNVTDMRSMFSGASAFNQPIGKWDVAKATDMASMFAEAKSFNQAIGNWNVSNVTKMAEMFKGAESFNQPLKWDVSSVDEYPDLFLDAKQFNQNLSDWNFSKWIDNGTYGSRTYANQSLNGTSIDKENYCAIQSAWIKKCIEKHPNQKDVCEQKMNIASDKNYTCDSE